MTKETVLETIAQAEAYLKSSSSGAFILTLYAALLHALLWLTETIPTITNPEERADLATLKQRAIELRDASSQWFNLVAELEIATEAESRRMFWCNKLKEKYLLFINQLYSELQVNLKLDDLLLDNLFDLASEAELTEFDLENLGKEFVDLYEMVDQGVEYTEHLWWLTIRSIRLFFAQQESSTDLELSGAVFDLVCRLTTELCVNGQSLYHEWDPNDIDAGHFEIDPLSPYPGLVAIDQAGKEQFDHRPSMLQLAPAYTLYQTLKHSN